MTLAIREAIETRGAGIRPAPNAVRGRGWRRWSGWGWGMLGCVLLASGGCGREPAVLPPGALIVTQVPLGEPGAPAVGDVLTQRYPLGSRIVAVPAPGEPSRVILLSDGLAAAGAPSLSEDGREVLFCGQSAPGTSWQIYVNSVLGGRPRALTDLPGGAMDPGWLPGRTMVFCSPVPVAAGRGSEGGGEPPALFTQALTGGVPARLTHGILPAMEPAVLTDGRVLFVSATTDVEARDERARSLFTVNSDGTEVSAFAAQHDGPASLRRPREVAGERVMFLAAGVGASAVEGRIEQVQMAQPFRSRSVAFPQIEGPCRAIEAGPDGTVLATLRSRGALGSFAVYRLAAGATVAETPVFDDPAWHDVEAVSPDVPRRVMGRVPAMDATRNSGIVLCLNGRLGDWRDPGASLDGAVAVRWYRHVSPDSVETLGEVALSADGSFLVEVPSDVALSLEALDGEGRVLRRCGPTFWVRPGENRSCIGCHEPHNVAPDNRRPLAVAGAAVRLMGGDETPTRQTASR